MKKMLLNPLALDKQTIAKMDSNQLQDVIGGRFGPGSKTTASSNGGSTGCGSGSSQCGRLAG